MFRIGHLGDLNEPMLLGALTAVEMALRMNNIPHGRGGVDAAMDYLAADPSAREAISLGLMGFARSTPDYGPADL